ncbi:PPE domain-containing protein [Mycolicibacterium arenosum]|uniref:PPE family protein n=1 Tax=Mycolicibacterium arenosum TaxID=2952157 RepID=A0ABT1LYZ7_9MYCO|nr:PPE domain-containing protein [Mycolicibacterium sp. CAU 1645]MCP9271545.1 PPE family protein [Mycolicibacterium sp. CAU 1645]
MSFTDVVWESRSTEQLARDLTTGPGPGSVGDAGAAWVRVANELASVSADYDAIIARLRTSFDSEAAAAVAVKLEDFGKWLQAFSLGAAANGQRAEEAAVANTVAILAMPTVSEALEARAAGDMMASLAAYNGAVLTGRFAEFDEAARADHADASAVMRQYEGAVAHLAQPWDQPLPQDICKRDALAAERQSTAGGAGGGVSGGGGSATMPTPLAPWAAGGAKGTAEPKALQRTSFAGGASAAGMGGAPYAPMAGYGRGGDQDREHESPHPAGMLAGAGEQGAGLSEADVSWLPVAGPSDAPFVVSNVSWGPDSGLFDELAAVDEPEPARYAEEESQRNLEQVADRWVALPVIGHDRSAQT